MIMKTIFMCTASLCLAGSALADTPSLTVKLSYEGLCSSSLLVTVMPSQGKESFAILSQGKTVSFALQAQQQFTLRAAHSYTQFNLGSIDDSLNFVPSDSSTYPASIFTNDCPTENTSPTTGTCTITITQDACPYIDVNEPPIYQY